MRGFFVFISNVNVEGDLVRMTFLSLAACPVVTLLAGYPPLVEVRSGQTRGVLLKYDTYTGFSIYSILSIYTDVVILHHVLYYKKKC